MGQFKLWDPYDFALSQHHNYHSYSHFFKPNKTIRAKDPLMKFFSLKATTAFAIELLAIFMACTWALYAQGMCFLTLFLFGNEGPAICVA